MFFNKYFFTKVGRRKHTGKFLMLQFYKSLLQFYKKQENRPYTRLYGRFSYLRLSTYSSQSFRSEHCLRSRFAHSYITVISRIHYRQHSVRLFCRSADGLPAWREDQCGNSGICGRSLAPTLVLFLSPVHENRDFCGHETMRFLSSKRVTLMARKSVLFLAIEDDVWMVARNSGFFMAVEDWR